MEKGRRKQGEGKEMGRRWEGENKEEERRWEGENKEKGKGRRKEEARKDAPLGSSAAHSSPFLVPQV